ncbi:hypothetical protein ES703_125427 [subsurface metagenome]
MSATIVEFTRMNSISGVVIRQGVRPYKYVYRSQPGIGGNIIKIDSTTAELYSWLRVSNIKVGSR